MLMFTLDRFTFGMTKPAYLRIFDLIKEDLHRPTQGRHPRTLHDFGRFGIFMEYLRTNSYCRTVGAKQGIRVTEGTVCNCVEECSRLLSAMVPKVKI